MSFNLRRDARPLETIIKHQERCAYSLVSISDEMPGPLRPQSAHRVRWYHASFNLRRDARPLETHLGSVVVITLLSFHSRRDVMPLETYHVKIFTLSQLQVSISDEMPGPL